MRPFVVIRQYESADLIARKELIKQYAMSFAFDAFISCLFREVNIYYPFEWSFNLWNENSVINLKIECLWLIDCVFFFQDFHSTGCAGGGCNVYFLWFTFADLPMFVATCCCFHLYFGLWRLFYQSVGIVKCKFGWLYSVIGIVLYWN